MKSDADVTERIRESHASGSRHRGDGGMCKTCVLLRRIERLEKKVVELLYEKHGIEFGTVPRSDEEKSA